MREITRRALLTSATVGAVAGAGCTIGSRPGTGDGDDCPAVRRASAPDDSFEVGVVRVDRRDDAVETTFRVTTPDHSKTTYDGTRIVVYDADGNELDRVPFGTLDPQATVDRTVELGRFPFLFLGDADDGTHDWDCRYPEMGSWIRGYLGYYESGAPDFYTGDDTGHLWDPLESRHLSDPVPPDDVLFDRVKCFHRWISRRESSPDPDLTAVRDSDVWLDREIPDPTVRESYQINGGRPIDDGDREWYTERAEVAFEDAPDRLRSALRRGRGVNAVDERDFFEIVSELDGESVQSPDELQPCSNDNVVCRDTRSENCRAGGGQFGGEYAKYVWYFVRYEGELYPFVPCYIRSWLPPDADSEYPTCRNERAETYTMYLHPDPSSHGAFGTDRTVGEAPPSVRSRIAAVGETDQLYARRTLSEDAWKEAAGALDGEDPSLPDCRRDYVDCRALPRDGCDGGERVATYLVDVDGETWGVRMEYLWNRYSDS